MAQALKSRKTARGTRMPPVHEYRPSHCETCDKAILPGHTWKWTPKGGKVHYHCEVKRNPAGPTYGQAMNMALAAGAKIGDTSGFEPWLIRAKLGSRGPLVKSKLKAEFWKGVETGEVPAVKSATEKKATAEKKAAPVAIADYQIFKDSEGNLRTQFAPEKTFATLKDVMAFVDAQKNPSPRFPEVTDHALRSRANTEDRRPADPRICVFCGSDQNVEVGHLDGHEENSDPKNLVWNCRSCNTRLGHIFKVLGIGRRTRQYNPETQGAQSYEQYVTALDALKGGNLFMSVDAAVSIIHATSPEDRSYYARQIWRIRKQRYGEGGTYKSAHRNPNGGQAA